MTVNLYRCDADCDETDELVEIANLSATTTAAADVGATTSADDDGSPVQLHISPAPNERGELVRAVGSSVVFTCRTIVLRDVLAAEATTVEWFDKNDMMIPSQTAHRLRQTVIIIIIITTTIRSTHPSRPNIQWVSNVRPPVRTSVRPQKSFFDFNEIWYAGRGRRVTHDCMQCDRIQGQGQGQEPLKV